MANCQYCGGQLGVDCFNQSDCGWITQQQEIKRLANESNEKYQNDIDELATELAHLRAELAAAREDSARLDAVQRENWTVHYCSMLSRWEVLTDHAHPAHRKTYTGKTARAAIDAARKGEAMKPNYKKLDAEATPGTPEARGEKHG